MTHKTDIYKAYLLRLQRSTEEAPWRIRLEDAQSREIIKFRSEQEFLQFIKELLGETGDREDASLYSIKPLQRKGNYS